MKNPFKKADSAKLPAQGKERTEIDYAHRTIIRHILYAYPDAFSGCASYPDYADPQMFADVMAQAADAVKKLDLDEHTPVFDELVRLKAQQLAISSLVETRYYHHSAALNLQADLRLQVENLRASKKLIEEQLADVNARIQKLEA
mgnify:FL=1